MIWFALSSMLPARRLHSSEPHVASMLSSSICEGWREYVHMGWRGRACVRVRVHPLPMLTLSHPFV
eukprot:364485-Chlamydomonas_euryale.AAC.3